MNKDISERNIGQEAKEVYLGGKSREDVGGSREIIKLSSNENLLGASPAARKVILKELDLVHEYPDRTDKRLKKALVKAYNNEISPEHLITANGGTEIVQLIANAFLGEGLESIVSNPCFKPYALFSGRAGAMIIDVPLRLPDYRFDADATLKAINPNTRVVWLCSPNNPTGTHISKHQLKHFLEEIPDGVLVVYDEVYHHFADEPDYTIGLNFIKEDYPIIAINSFSKAYGLAGMRIGYAYGRIDLISRLQTWVRPFHINSLSLRSAEAALGDEAFIEETIATIVLEKKWLYKELDKLQVKYWKTQANFILIRPKMDAYVFEQAMLERGIMVRPVEKFGAPGCVRVTVGSREINIVYIQALASIINHSDLWQKG